MIAYKAIKGRLVNAIYKEYVAKTQPSFECFTTVSDALKIFNKTGRKRYHTEANEIIQLRHTKILTLIVNSNHAALALEAMISSKLYNLGYALPKIFWNDLKVPGRRVGATECYSCHVKQAIDVGVDMANIYYKNIELF